MSINNIRKISFLFSHQKLEFVEFMFFLKKRCSVEQHDVEYGPIVYAKLRV